jgi:hypothetical protein
MPFPSQKTDAITLPVYFMVIAFFGAELPRSVYCYMDCSFVSGV